MTLRRTILPYVALALGLPPPTHADAPVQTLTIEAIFGEASLSGRAPHGVKIAPDGSKVGFLLGSPDNQYQLDLWVFDPHEGKPHRLVDSKELVPKEELSLAEKSRRERARAAQYHGIADYIWSRDGRRLLFPLGSALYLYDLQAAPGAAVRKLVEGEALLDPKFSPGGHYVSYLSGQNLYAIDLASGRTIQLTRDGGGTVHNAEAEFVAQEEMDQFSGYWWAPDDSAIAFKQFDEAPVPEVRRFEVFADRTEVITQRYPGAGDHNVSVRLGLVALSDAKIRWVDLGSDPDIYLPRVEWLPDSRQVSYQRESRNQQRLDLVLVDAASLAQRTVLTETDSHWINLNHDLHFLRHTPAFIWASERSGFKHLYLYGTDGRLIRPLSAGAWNVDHLLAVDEEAGLLYLASNFERITESQIFTLRLDGRDPQAPQQVSQGSGWHEAAFASEATTVQLYVDSFSDPVTPPQTGVRAADGHLLAWIEENRLDATHPYWPYRQAHVKPEFGQIPAADGQALFYRLYKPLNFDAGRRYPVMLYVYGGPSIQLVTDQWDRDLFPQYMAQHGYVVFSVDNRGSARRGRRFSDPIFRKLGEVEVQDQLTAVRWLKQQPFVDPGRVGVFGWSYGGFMTVMLLAKASDQFAAGASGAPVTEWRLYDTHYTERYLGKPSDNAAGYDASAVFPYLEGLRSPLLLIHGMADDNVLFLNSTRLMSELQTRGTQFRLMTYPGGKHGLSTPQMKKHAFHLIADFFDEQLKR